MMKKIIAILLFFGVLFANNCRMRLFSLSTEGQNSINLESLITDIADTCNLNIMIKDEVAKNRLKENLKYIKLRNVTLKELLDFLLKENGFFYSLKGNMLVISYIKTENFKIDYVNSVITGATNFSASTTSGDSGTNTLNTTFNFDFWSQFSSNITQILNAQTTEFFKNPPPIIDKTTGLVTITGTRRQLESIKNYIDSLNKRLHKEVLIDVKIYSVKLLKNHQVGVDWNKFNIAFDKTASVTAPNLIGSTSIFKSGTFNINGLLNFLSGYGQINSISNPKITTLNNQKAIITVGQTINYSYKSVTKDANGNAVQSDNIDSKFVGILLDITPEISDNGVIMMSINPSVSSLSQNQLNLTLPPNTIEKKLNTIVRVKDGDTIILGGLITDEKNFVQQGVPILKEIPLIKYMFSTKAETSTREELIFVITPHIIDLNKKVDVKDIGYKETLPNLGDL